MLFPQAEEVGGRSDAMTSVPVTIVVTDADDQRPMFSAKIVHVTLGEDLGEPHSLL